MNDAIKEILTKCGVLQSCAGYMYLIDAINLVIEDKKLPMGEVYRTVGRVEKATSSAVERAIRYAKETVINNPNDYVKALFEASMNVTDGVTICNKEFVHTIANLLRSEPAEMPEQDQTEAEMSEVMPGGSFISPNVRKFLEDDNRKIDKLIELYPISLPVAAIADFLQLDAASVRATIENGKIGLAWKKIGKANHAYHIPTAKFVRWYLNMEG